MTRKPPLVIHRRRRATPERRSQINSALKELGAPVLTNAEYRALETEGEAWLWSIDARDHALRVVSDRRRRRALRPDSVVLEHVPRWVWARSLLYAIEAEQLPQVQEFRETYLSRNLIELDEVRPWVEDQYEAPSVFALLLVPSGWQLGDPLAAQSEVVSVCTEAIEYPVDGRGLKMPIRRGSVLDQLRQLSNELAMMFGWQPAQATGFVLTGITPIVNVLVAKPGDGYDGDQWRRDTVRLDVDLDVSPDEVAALYSRARAPLRGERPRPARPEAVEWAVLRGENPQLSTKALYVLAKEERDPGPDELRAFRQSLKDVVRRIKSGPRTRPRTGLNWLLESDAAGKSLPHGPQQHHE